VLFYIITNKIAPKAFTVTSSFNYESSKIGYLVS
jgi:hypothetical protein